METLREHFEPIITAQEEEYNERFYLDTQVQILNLTKEGEAPSHSPKSFQKSSNLNSQILQAMQQQTNAILESNRVILEGIKSITQRPSPLGGVDWTPIIQGALTGLAK